MSQSIANDFCSSSCLESISPGFALISSPSVQAASIVLERRVTATYHGHRDQHPWCKCLHLGPILLSITDQPLTSDVLASQILNQHPSFSLADGSHKATLPFRVGVSEDCNKRWRRTMEDSHAFVYDFAGVHGQGFFGIFDGHAGKQAAEWCGHNFHQVRSPPLKSSRLTTIAYPHSPFQCLLDTLASRPGEPVPDLLNATFQSVDQQLSQIGKDKGSASGCTAVTAFLRLEDENGQPIPPSADADNASDSSLQTESDPEQVKSKESAGIFSGISKRLKGSPTLSRTTSGHETTDKGAVVKARRVLYTANVGDARAVLWYVPLRALQPIVSGAETDADTTNFTPHLKRSSRGGKAIRLTYDHKGSDPQEAKRITDAGGFVMNNRVNGVFDTPRSRSGLIITDPQIPMANRSTRGNSIARRLCYEGIRRRLAVHHRDYSWR